MPLSEFNITAVLVALFGVLLACSVLLTRVLERLGVPVVLVFLVLGMLAGEDGPGGLAFSDYRFSFRVGTIALILILLDGGLGTSLRNVRRSLAPAGLLATVGVAATAGLVALVGRLFGLGWPAALLLGAVVSSTDAAMVFAVLRGTRLHLTPHVGATLELESGLNDPLAVILTTTVTHALLAEQADFGALLLEIPVQLVVGALVGLGIGYGSQRLLARVHLSTGAFYPVLTVATALLAFGAATLAHGSGFLAVYVAAVLLGNGPLPYRTGMRHVHEALAWLSQITMFLMLGLLITPSALVPVMFMGLAVALVLAFVLRPLVVAGCLAPFRFPRREIAFIGWVGLRGAVPIILAMYPVLSGVPGATDVFHLVFFVVVVSAFVPGATIPHVTRRLGLEQPQEPKPAAALEISSTRVLRGELLSFWITPTLAVCGAKLAEIEFPESSAAILIVRGDELIAPRGPSVLQPGDHGYVFCRPEDRPFLELLFGRPEESAAAE